MNSCPLQAIWILLSELRNKSNSFWDISLESRHNVVKHVSPSFAKTLYPSIFVQIKAQPQNIASVAGSPQPSLLLGVKK